jgi:hypothetical protein
VNRSERNAYRPNFGCLFVIAVISIAVSLLVCWLEQT